MSKDLYGYGSYSARIKVPHAPSSITGFFLYEPPDYASEMDVEIYNDSSRKMVIYATYSGGAQTHSETMTLPFDPTTGFHEYRFDYAPDSVSFYANGQLMKEWMDGILRNSMKLYVNAWYPRWLEGRRSRTDKLVLVDEIRHVQQQQQEAEVLPGPCVRAEQGFNRRSLFGAAPRAASPARVSTPAVRPQRG